MNHFSKFLVLSVLILSLVGCGGGGGGFFSSLGDAFTSGFSSGSSSSDSGSGFSDSGSGGGGIQVAQVHHPEPATMLLWGAGLVGAALLRRKKKS